MRFYLIHEEVKLIYGIRNQISDCMGQVRVRGVCSTEGSFWHYGTFLYHDLDDVYTGIYICQTSSNCTLKMYNNDILINVITKKKNLARKLEQLSFPSVLIIFSLEKSQLLKETLGFYLSLCITRSNKYLKIQQTTSFFAKSKVTVLSSSLLSLYFNI